MKKMKLKKFFKRCFPPMEDCFVYLFWNMKTGNAEFVTRTGDIFLVVPRNSRFSSDDDFKKYIYSLRELIVDMVCDASDWFYFYYPAGWLSNRFEYPRSPYPEFCYHPDDYE